MNIVRFIKDWALIIAIFAGVAAYFVYVNIPILAPTKPFVNNMIGIVQPLLIFAMLFLTYCRVDPCKLRLQKWHLWALLIQCGVFSLVSCVLIAMPQSNLRVVLEGVMICMICPTATAGAVITKKLGGDVYNITTYTILINLATAILIPALVPFVHPNPGMSVFSSALLILSKVFPLLLAPFFAAMVLRYAFRRLYDKLGSYQDLSFYLWTVALALATAVTARSIVHSHVDVATQLWLVVVSLVCCCLQFYLGRKIGARYNDKITAGQSFGQKNTILAIWIGYTYFTPVTAVVGGFYSIWHNVINSYQLYEHKKIAQQVVVNSEAGAVLVAENKDSIND